MARLLLLTLSLCLSFSVRLAAAEEFLALCYHDVANEGEGMTVSRDMLVAQFSWLREHGYTPVSIDDLLAARAGERSLPEKAVLISFDDGYVSFYRQVFPLLKAFRYPAVLGVVGRWLDAAPGEKVPYGQDLVPRERFMTWEQLREVAASGLVEIASHSYDLHRGITANPQGNRQPAMTTRCYETQSSTYENDKAYEKRVRGDFSRNADLLRKQLGTAPRVMVWPYGEYNQIALKIAREAGMPLTLSLSARANHSGDLSVIGRILIQQHSSLAAFIWSVRHPEPEKTPQRVIHVDLDYVYDPDPEQQEHNLGLLLDRVLELGATTVYLQAFADPDGDGVADQLYFPNRHLPMRADLFNRAAWQLRTRTGVEVYAWLPVLAYTVGERKDLVLAWQPEAEPAPAAGRYRRLSPFSTQAAGWVRDICEDLAKHAAFAGVLFHDDAFLTDYEDAGKHALAAYRAAGLPGDIGRIRPDPHLMAAWTDLKIESLNRFIEQLVAKIRIYRPELKTARNLYALTILDPISERWFAQNLQHFLARYDYTAVMAMPYMEQAEEPEAWLVSLVGKINDVPEGLEKVVFELQSRDWRSNEQIPAEVLTRHMEVLRDEGAIHYGYYPDDFLSGRPASQVIMPFISGRSSPYRP